MIATDIRTFLMENCDHRYKQLKSKKVRVANRISDNRKTDDSAVANDELKTELLHTNDPTYTFEQCYNASARQTLKQFGNGWKSSNRFL